jgi:glucose/arabinose dehydrogenase
MKIKVVLMVLFFSSFSLHADTLLLETIRLPKGFSIDLLAEGIPTARGMAVGDKGTIFVGSKSGQVTALVDDDGDFKVDSYYKLVDELEMPVGVAYRDGDLYISEISRITVLRDIESRLENPPALEIVNDSFPTDKWHGWKFIRFSPDGLLYVPVGAPCNVCEKKDSRYSSIMRMNPDGSGLELYSSGVRNTVGFDWHPETGELWFTDNGRDWMGDNMPADELNHAPSSNIHFGFPYFHGAGTPDPRFGRGKKRSDYREPAILLGPHVAALGMRFYDGEMFPETYEGVIFIAEHGSWNRSVPIGYRITMVRLNGNKAVSYENFAEGWLQGEEAWGRPVDVEILADGSMLISDDRANCIYRVVYNK